MATFRMPALPKMSGKAGATHACVCGCGMPTKRTWHPGHDGRATGWAIRIEAGVMSLADVPDNERKGAEIRLVQRAAAKGSITKVG